MKVSNDAKTSSDRDMLLTEIIDQIAHENPNQLWLQYVEQPNQGPMELISIPY